MLDDVFAVTLIGTLISSKRNSELIFYHIDIADDSSAKKSSTSPQKEEKAKEGKCS
jgi:hypothetical protein